MTPRHTIIVGDVHGCLDEFRELVEVTGYRQGTDRLVLVGDVMDRGPKPVECVRFAREIGAEVVLGNHDEVHLRWRRHEDSRKFTGRTNPMRPMSEERLTANLALTDDALDWMRTWPLWLEIQDEDESIVVVHAGLMPSTPLGEQQSGRMMHIRWVDSEDNSYVSLSEAWVQPEGTRFWTDVWDGPHSVIYGHSVYSREAPRIDVRPNGTTCWGIDTGCVYGGKLTAIVLPDRQIISLHSKRPYARWNGPHERPPATPSPTSQAAHRAVAQAASCIAEKLWQFIGSKSADGVTADEVIVAFPALSHPTITARMRALKFSGLLERHPEGVGRKTRTGRDAEVWVARTDLDFRENYTEPPTRDRDAERAVLDVARAWADGRESLATLAGSILSVYGQDPIKPDPALVDRVAQAIYHHECGLTDEEHAMVMGAPRKLWKTDAPWDTNPDELAEHERDEYRMQAEAAIAVILGLGG